MSQPKAKFGLQDDFFAFVSESGEAESEDGGDFSVANNQTEAGDEEQGADLQYYIGHISGKPAKSIEQQQAAPCFKLSVE